MLQVNRATEHHKQAALQLLYSEHEEQAQQAYLNELLKAEAQGLLSLEGLFLAKQSAETAGVGLCIHQPDGTAYVWPPVISPDVQQLSGPAAYIETQDALIQTMTNYLRNQQTWLAQVLLDCNDTATRQIFLRNGYNHITDLLFLSKTTTSETEQPPHPEAEWILYDQKQTHQRFADVIEQTYTDSQDCPELNNVRTADQALQSYQLSGHFDPALWFLLHENGNDQGVLLLSAHPDEQCCELVYFGLIPTARGQGWGERMIAFAMHQASVLKFHSLFLAVDERNEPAIRLYKKMGFHQTTSRTVCAKVLQNSE